MAKFISSIGQISGKLGGVVFKRRGNKTFITKVPEHIKPVKDPVTLQRRRKFAWVGKFTKAVNSSPILHALWKPQSTRSVSVYNHIFQSVYGNIDIKDLSGIPVFIPNFLAFSLTNKSVTFGKSSIFVESDPLGVNLGIDLAKEISILAAGIIVFSDPETEGLPEFFFLSVQSGKILVSLNDPPVFKIPLTGRDLYIYSQYRTKKIYLTLITLDASGNPVRHSVIIS
jgi:hypothetical protein